MNPTNMNNKKIKTANPDKIGILSRLIGHELRVGPILGGVFFISNHN